MVSLALAAVGETPDARAVSRSRNPRPMPRAVGLPLLVLSGLGFPLSQLAIGKLGRHGALLVEGITTALLIKDTYLVANGAPARLEPVPRALLYAELGVAACASALGLRALSDRGMAEATRRTPDAGEIPAACRPRHALRATHLAVHHLPRPGPRPGWALTGVRAPAPPHPRLPRRGARREPPRGWPVRSMSAGLGCRRRRRRG